jgi:hypothetical protein
MRDDLDPISGRFTGTRRQREMLPAEVPPSQRGRGSSDGNCDVLTEEDYLFKGDSLPALDCDGEVRPLYARQPEFL